MSVPPARAPTGPVPKHREPCRGLPDKPCTNTAPDPRTAYVAIDLDGNEKRWLCETQCKSENARRLGKLKQQLENAAALRLGFPGALQSHVSRMPGSFKIVDTPCTAIQDLAAAEGVDLNDGDAVAGLVDRYWNDKLSRDLAAVNHASIVRAQKVLEETGEYKCPRYTAVDRPCNAQGDYETIAKGTFAGIQRVRVCKNCYKAVGRNPESALKMKKLDKLFEMQQPPPRFYVQRTYDEMIAQENEAAANPQDPELWALAESVVGQVPFEKNVEETLDAVIELLPPEYKSVMPEPDPTSKHSKLWIIIMKLVRARVLKKKEAAAEKAAAEKTAMD